MDTLYTSYTLCREAFDQCNAMQPMLVLSQKIVNISGKMWRPEIGLIFSFNCQEEGTLAIFHHSGWLNISLIDMPATCRRQRTKIVIRCWSGCMAACSMSCQLKSAPILPQLITKEAYPPQRLIPPKKKRHAAPSLVKMHLCLFLQLLNAAAAYFPQTCSIHPIGSKRFREEQGCKVSEV